MKRKISFLLICFLIIGSFLTQIPLSSAVSGDVVAIFPITNAGSGGSGLNTVHPAVGASYSARSQSFQTWQNGYLESISVWVYQDINPSPFYTIDLACRVTNSTSGANDDPNGETLLAQSLVNIDLTNVNNNTAGTQITFEFNSTLLLSSSTWYQFYVYAVPDSGSIGNWIKIKTNLGGSGSYAGYAHEYTSGAWGDDNYDTCFYVTALDAQPTPTPTPVVTPTPVPADVSWGIWATLTPYANLFLPLIFILVVAIVCGRYGGVWGFFAGLNVSCILIYAVMGATYFPLWGMVLLGLIDGALLFGKITGRI